MDLSVHAHSGQFWSWSAETFSLPPLHSCSPAFEGQVPNQPMNCQHDWQNETQNIWKWWRELTSGTFFMLRRIVRKMWPSAGVGWGVIVGGWEKDWSLSVGIDEGKGLFNFVVNIDWIIRRKRRGRVVLERLTKWQSMIGINFPRYWTWIISVAKFNSPVKWRVTDNYQNICREFTVLWSPLRVSALPFPLSLQLYGYEAPTDWRQDYPRSREVDSASDTVHQLILFPFDGEARKYSQNIFKTEFDVTKIWSTRSKGPTIIANAFSTFKRESWWPPPYFAWWLVWNMTGINAYLWQHPNSMCIIVVNRIGSKVASKNVRFSWSENKSSDQQKRREANLSPPIKRA